jgi:hypothetical protein
MATWESNEREYDGLVVANYPITTERAVLVTGQSVVRGQALGKITASGKLATWTTGASDGSENFYALATETVDATAADKSIGIYKGGKFAKEKVVIDGTSADTIATLIAPARALGIWLVDGLDPQV